MSTPDPFDLARFVTAQEPCIEDVRAELAAGRKMTHWMWFVFPQMRGLGASSMASHYGIVSRAEAKAYMRHDVLGPRLIECTELVTRLHGLTARDIFGGIDSLKFRSSMTLFAAMAPDLPAFTEALAKYFAGQPDPRTLELLRHHSQ